MMSATVAAFAAYFLSLSLHRIWRRCARDNAKVYIKSADESISTLYRGLLGKGMCFLKTKFLFLNLEKVKVADLLLLSLNMILHHI